MNRFLLATALTLASIAPSFAQTNANHNHHSLQSIAALRLTDVAAPRVGCVGSYFGAWSEGYPGTGNAC
jgi:hypothetical protein